MESELIELKGNALVISPHPNDTGDFKARLPQLISLFQRKACKYYSISVEHPDTNWHLDIVYFINNERKNFDRGIKKLLDDFESSHENTKTIKTSKGSDRGFQSFQNIKNSIDDIKYRVGYNVKEDPDEYWRNIPDEFLDVCIRHYMLKSPEKKALNFPVIAPKASSLLEHMLQYKHNNPGVAYEELWLHMVKYGNYSFLNISEKVHKKALLELKLRNGLEYNVTEEDDYQTLYGVKDWGPVHEAENTEKINKIRLWLKHQKDTFVCKLSIEAFL